MTASEEPAAFMDREIAEQPQVWRRLLASDQFDAAAEQVRRRRPRFVLLAARGTSDHAALYAKYLVEVSHQLPAGLVSPSTMTAYGAKPDLRDVLMFGISQSGGSPDLIKSLEVARAQGALTVGVTNDAESDLAQVAEVHVDVLAGREWAVAATKSYTAQLLALYLLLDHVRGGSGTAATALPDLGDDLLDRSPQIAAVAQRYRFAQRLVTTARGYSYPTAREAALKLMESSYLSAQAFSGADLMHGPLAVVDAQVPVMTVIANGPGGEPCTRCFRAWSVPAPMCSPSAPRRRLPSRPTESCCRRTYQRRCPRSWRSCLSSSSRCTLPSREARTPMRHVG